MSEARTCPIVRPRMSHSWRRICSDARSDKPMFEEREACGHGWKCCVGRCAPFELAAYEQTVAVGSLNALGEIFYSETTFI